MWILRLENMVRICLEIFYKIIFYRIEKRKYREISDMFSEFGFVNYKIFFFLKRMEGYLGYCVEILLLGGFLDMFYTYYF